MKFPVGNETIDCSGPGAQPPLSAATCYKKRKHVNVNHGFNDDKLNQWLGDTDVYVHYLFFPPKEYSYDLPYFIRLTGIDTLATVKLNNQVKRFISYSKGYIDVGDGCWRQNVLVTTKRCW